jgi:hypothetical protein
MRTNLSRFAVNAAVSLAVSAGCGSAAMADFSYAFVFGQPTEIVLLGEAEYSPNGDMRLTTAGDQSGAMWHEQQQKVDSGFVTTFRFRIETPNTPGDGFAFVLHNDPAGTTAIGGGGSAMGYGPGVDHNSVYHEMISSIAIEFDTFGCCGEAATPHVAIHTQGLGINTNDDSAVIAMVELGSVGVDILDSRSHTASIQYIPPDGMNPGMMSVYIDSTLVVSTDLDLQDIGGEDITAGGYMFMGFTAATGLADSTHVITDWAVNDDNFGCVSPYWHVIGWGGSGIGGTMGATWQVVGTRPMDFRWYRYGVEVTDDDGGRIQGLGTDTFEITNFAFTDQGFYHCVASNACGDTTSIRVFLGICVADVDDGSASGVPDGGVGIEDLLYYLSQYDSGSILADVDDGNGYGIADGGVGIEDLLFYLGRYDGGC